MPVLPVDVDVLSDIKHLYTGLVVGVLPIAKWAHRTHWHRHPPQSQTHMYG